ncbi:MAG: UDP-N-acetylmuramate--L-alanine ligase [Clostridia bacterium]
MFEIDELLKKVKRIHFIGIGGSGMCPLAEILHFKGYEISGSDNNTGDTLNKIMSLGIPVTLGQKKENIKDAEMVIYTAAIFADNEELLAAKASVPTFERSVIFGAISRMYGDCIAVCGTHGKTTVTSMLTQVLVMAEKDPTAVIGGRLPLIDSHGRIGESETMVCEACEYVNTYHELDPNVAVILNVDADHLEFFKNIENIIKSFNKFANMASRSVIYNGDDTNTCTAVSDVKTDLISFGFAESNTYYPANITYNRGAFAEFDVMNNGEMLTHIKLQIPGEHNILNSLAVFAAATNSGCTPDECKTGIEAFAGAGRRFEILGEVNGITIADDYAHHPKELEAILSSVMKMNYGTVWAVFQPFTYSRTSLLLDDFARVLSLPDKCVMTEIMGAREKNTYDVYTKDLADKIPDSVWFEGFEGVSDYVVKYAKAGDLIITLGCGDIYKAAKIMIEKLSK